MLQVRAIDRSIFGIDLQPKLIEGILPEENTYNIILPMTRYDFNLIEKASDGPEKMQLSALYNFSRIAEKYGYSKATYLREILFRLAEPLLLVIISIFALIISWRFRLEPGTRFKKHWIFSAPLCPILAYLLMQSARYICKLLIAFFVSLTLNYAWIIVFTTLIILFINVTLWLFYQRSE